MDYKQSALKLIQTEDPNALEDAFDMVRWLELESAVEVDGEFVYNAQNFKDAHELAREIRQLSAKGVRDTGSAALLALNKRTLLFDSPYDFDAYCRYIEWDRPKEKRFYEPRRKRLKQVADALQTLADGELDLLGISLPPGVGKTTIAIFFLCWLAGKHPDQPILGGSHSNSFLRGVYDECMRIFDPRGEYLWSDVFPRSMVVETNAKDMRIDLAEPKRFQTLQFSSIGSGNAGKVRAQQLLYCDDLVEGIEQAMSRERMDKLWNQYTTDLRQRKIGDCKELHIATRWSVNDPLGRLEAANEDNPRAKFIRFPALNENDESNFDYGNAVGFSTQFYRQQRDIMDTASFLALYQNQPIEREGILYHREELRRFFKLPDREPDSIIAICDTKEQGADYCVMPVAYQFGNDFYIDKFICDNGKVEVVEERVAQLLVDRGVQSCRIESNRGGTLFAQNVEKRVRDMGGVTNITTKWTQSNKATRIEINSSWVKTHCLFWDESLYKEDQEYKTAMKFLTSYTSMGKNKFDDVPDVLSMFVDFVLSFAANKVTVMRRPF